MTPLTEQPRRGTERPAGQCAFGNRRAATGKAEGTGHNTCPDDATVLPLETGEAVRARVERTAPILELAPFAREQGVRDGRATAWVCRDFTCDAPRADLGEVLAALRERE